MTIEESILVIGIQNRAYSRCAEKLMQDVESIQ